MGVVAAPSLRPCRRVECGIFVFKGRPPASVAAAHETSHPGPAGIEDPRSRQRRASAATTCSRSGSARATRRRRRTSARPRSARSRDGETFYSHNLGLPELREALAALRQRAASGRSTADRIAVTSSGVNALMLAMQALVGRRRRGGRRRPGLAEPDGAAGDPRRARRAAAACGRERRRVAARPRCAARRRDRRAPACCSSIRRTTRPAGR